MDMALRLQVGSRMTVSKSTDVTTHVSLRSEEPSRALPHSACHLEKGEGRFTDQSPRPLPVPHPTLKKVRVMKPATGPMPPPLAPSSSSPGSTPCSSPGMPCAVRGKCSLPALYAHGTAPTWGCSRDISRALMPAKAVESDFLHVVCNRDRWAHVLVPCRAGSRRTWAPAPSAPCAAPLQTPVWGRWKNSFFGSDI